MTHLKKSASGHLLKNSGGHLVNGCDNFNESSYTCTICSGWGDRTPANWTVVISGCFMCTHNCVEVDGRDGYYTLTANDINGTYILGGGGSSPGHCVWLTDDQPVYDRSKYWQYSSSCSGDPTADIDGNSDVILHLDKVGAVTTFLLKASGYPVLPYLFRGTHTTHESCETAVVINNDGDCGDVFLEGSYSKWGTSGGSATCTPGGSPFCETIHCTTHQHCPTCRNLEGGRDWREDLRKGFTLPDDKTDFECPHGVPWNPTQDQLPEPTWSASPPKPSFDIPAGAVAICESCEADQCDAGKRTDCEGNIFVQITAVCPRGRWQIETK